MGRVTYWTVVVVVADARCFLILASFFLGNESNRPDMVSVICWQIDTLCFVSSINIDC